MNDTAARTGPATIGEMQELLKLVVARLDDAMRSPRPSVSYLSLTARLLKDQSVKVTVSDEDRTNLEQCWTLLLAHIHRKLGSGDVSSREMAVAFAVLAAAEESLLQPRELTSDDLQAIMDRLPFKRA